MAKTALPLWGFGGLGLMPGEGTRSSMLQLRAGLCKDPTCCNEA